MSPIDQRRNNGKPHAKQMVDQCANGTETAIHTDESESKPAMQRRNSKAKPYQQSRAKPCYTEIIPSTVYYRSNTENNKC